MQKTFVAAVIFRIDDDMPPVSEVTSMDAAGSVRPISSKTPRMASLSLARSINGLVMKLLQF